MAKLIGNDIGIFIGGVLIACGTSCEISGDSETIDTRCKGTGDWGDSQNGGLSWSASSTNIIDYSATYGFSQIFTAWRTKTDVTLKYGEVTQTAGDKYYEGIARVGSWSRTDGMNEASTYTVNFEGKGAIDEKTAV